MRFKTKKLTYFLVVCFLVLLLSLVMYADSGKAQVVEDDSKKIKKSAAKGIDHSSLRAVVFRVYDPKGKPVDGAEVLIKTKTSNVVINPSYARGRTVNGMRQTYVPCTGPSQILYEYEVWSASGKTYKGNWWQPTNSWVCDETLDITVKLVPACPVGKAKFSASPDCESDKKKVDRGDIKARANDQLRAIVFRVYDSNCSPVHGAEIVISTKTSNVVINPKFARGRTVNGMRQTYVPCSGHNLPSQILYEYEVWSASGKTHKGSWWQGTNSWICNETLDITVKLEPVNRQNKWYGPISFVSISTNNDGTIYWVDESKNNLPYPAVAVMVRHNSPHKSIVSQAYKEKLSLWIVPDAWYWVAQGKKGVEVWEAKIQ